MGHVRFRYILHAMSMTRLAYRHQDRASFQPRVTRRLERRRCMVESLLRILQDHEILQPCSVKVSVTCFRNSYN